MYLYVYVYLSVSRFIMKFSTILSKYLRQILRVTRRLFYPNVWNLFTCLTFFLLNVGCLYQLLWNKVDRNICRWKDNKNSFKMRYDMTPFWLKNIRGVVDIQGWFNVGRCRFHSIKIISLQNCFEIFKIAFYFWIIFDNYKF